MVFLVGNGFSSVNFKIHSAVAVVLLSRSPIVEGALTLVMFFLFLVLLPYSPTHTAPIHGRFDLFSADERRILHHRVIVDDASKATAKANITLPVISAALVDWRLWVHTILNVVALAPKGGLQLYGPKIIKSLGFSKTRANALNSIGSFGLVVLSMLIGFTSDRTQVRGLWCIVSFIWSISFAGSLFSLPAGQKRWTHFALFILLSSGNGLAQGLNDAWVAVNSRTPEKRSIGVAMAVMGSNLGGLAGQQLFRSSDAPRYNHAFLAILVLYAASILIAGGITFVYWVLNRRMSRRSKVFLEESVGNKWKYQL